MIFSCELLGKKYHKYVHYMCFHCNHTYWNYVTNGKEILEEAGQYMCNNKRWEKCMHNLPKHIKEEVEKN